MCSEDFRSLQERPLQVDSLCLVSRVGILLHMQMQLQAGRCAPQLSVVLQPSNLLVNQHGRCVVRLNIAATLSTSAAEIAS